MIIKSKPAKLWGLKVFGYCMTKVMRLFFVNKMVIKPVDIKPDHSYILSCNHFGFGDGFISYYLAYHQLVKQGKMKRLYIMSLKKQMEMHWWLQYMGSFSVDPGKVSVAESLAYAAEVLSEPGNLLLFFPQANLESCHIQTIEFQNGLAEIVPRIKGNCQLLWSSNIVEYFESIKPSVYFNMLDCGTNHDFDFEKMKQQVNEHHKKALKSTVRFTKED